MRSFWPPRGGIPGHAVGGRPLDPAALPALLRAATFSASLSGRPSVGWEKRAVGDMWAERSNGKAVFLMVTQKTLGEIQNAARANA